MRWECRDFAFGLGGRPLVAGIVNATPDSFSDGRPGETADEAAARARELFAQGADFVDVGGESTRPGAARVDAAEEIRRAIPVVRALASEGFPVSIDTYREETARAALEAGAAIVNCVSPALEGPGIARAAAETRAGLVLTWTGAMPAAKPAGDGDPATVAARCAAVFGLFESHAASCGVGRGQMMFDPGLGFGKSAKEDFELMRHTRELAAKFPLMVGISRKSALGAVCGETVPAKRLGASVAAAAWTALAGAAVLRVHDVAETRQAVAVALELGREGLR